MTAFDDLSPLRTFALLPDWMIREDLLPGRLEHVLARWPPKDLPVHVVYAGAT